MEHLINLMIAVREPDINVVSQKFACFQRTQKRPWPCPAGDTLFLDRHNHLGVYLCFPVAYT